MMILEKCPTQSDLQALSLGQLPEEQSDDLLGHLQSCDSCQAELETADQVDDTLVRHLREQEVEQDFSEEVDCRNALARALGSLAQGDQQAIGDSELSNLLPRVLGEYEIVRPIGRGGMGSVYLARHSKLGRQVALKVLSSHRVMQPRMRQRFESEMRAIGQLSHPNIVTAHDAREVDELAVLVTEFIDGLDIAQILRRTGPLSVGDACEIARQTALALDYVNEQGLVHRDIKPSNIMLGKVGEVKLLDLGLARLQLGDDDRPEMTATGQAMGTADYIAPEQVNDSRNVDIRADIYALGCTLFKMLTGRPPFADDQYPTVFAKMTAHVSDSPPSLEKIAPEIPIELARLVQRMIAKDPKNRPQTPAEVAELLAKFTDWNDLKRLVEQAIATGELVDRPPTKPSVTPLVLQPEPKPFLFRRVPLLTAIAAGLLGTIIGFALGIIITIKYADGTRTQVEVPDGAAAKVTAEGNVEVEMAAGNADIAKEVKEQKPLLTKNPTMVLQGVWLVTSDDPDSAFDETINAFVDNYLISFINGDLDEKVAVTKFESLGDSATAFSFVTPDLKETVELLVRHPTNDRMTLNSRGVKYSFSRIASLPITEEVLLKIEANPETRSLTKTVKRIAEFEKTGELPVTYRGGSMKEAAMQTRSRNNLKQIGLAMHNFHDAFLSFPAATSFVREREKPKPVSWRVAILPFIGEADLYQRYRFDEEWDSEHNKTVLAQMPETFRLPGADASSTETPYLAIVGADTAITDPSVGLRDIRDGSSNTVLVVETKKMVPWTKPEDIPFAMAGVALQLQDLEPIYEAGFHALIGDGSVQLFHGDTDANIWPAWFTRNGGETIKK